MMDMSVDMLNKWLESDSATNDGLEMHFVVGYEEYYILTEEKSIPAMLYFQCVCWFHLHTFSSSLEM
uniref:Uncharacterized protein n=1 Tax=Aegilops tauschii subsp. strangulata TaxID=200361 RepID=A0A453S842_AEGTS